jgi:hypothetical protein
MEVHMVRTILSILAFSLLWIDGAASAQTAKELKEKLGEPSEAYSVTEHIWMTPTFTADGQLCEMRLYPKRISSTTNYLGEDKLRHWELKDALDKLAPPETRGARTKFFGLTFLLGQMSETTFAYENVSFTFLASLHFGTADSNPSKPAPAQAEPRKSTDELSIPTDAEIAVIILSNRVCPKP